MSIRCKARALLVGALAIGGCAAPPRESAPQPGPEGSAAVPANGPGTQAPPHLGRAFDVVAAESLLTVMVYRGGALARAGHNHVIASHGLAGSVYVPSELARTTCELRVPVDSLSVDEPALRAQLHDPAEFPPEVPQSAREGTQRNMLSEALLDAAHNAEIAVSCLGLAPVTDGHGRATLGISVRMHQATVTVPVEYALSGSELTVRGALPLKQSELGLTPFSAMLGALQVQDQMQVRFIIRARASRTSQPP